MRSCKLLVLHPRHEQHLKLMDYVDTSDGTTYVEAGPHFNPCMMDRDVKRKYGALPRSVIMIEAVSVILKTSPALLAAC